MAHNRRRLYAVELDVYQPGSGARIVRPGRAFGQGPFGASLGPPGVSVKEGFSLFLSDIGYVTPPNDPAGLRVYPATLASAFSVDRSIDLSLGGHGAGVAWGGIQIMNDAQRYAPLTATRNVDSRKVRILRGEKHFEHQRGIWKDQPYNTLTEVFAGLAKHWRPDEESITIPVRDATQWIERQLQEAVYEGTGRAEGTPQMKGRKKPKLRGGGAEGRTFIHRVKNITPVLIDPVQNIYQISDGWATIPFVTDLLENGIAVFQSSFGGSTGDPWTTNVRPGGWVLAPDLGMFKLGSPAVGTITCNAFGRFLNNAIHLGPARQCVELLMSDLGVSPEHIDFATFSPFYNIGVGGWYFDGAQPITGVDAVGLFAASIGGRIYPGRNGKLRFMRLVAPNPSAAVAATWTRDEIVRLSRQPLPEWLSPPPYRVRWGYDHNHTIMSGNQVHQTIVQSDPGLKTFLSESDRWASWGSAAVIEAFRKPSDPEPVPSVLLREGDAIGMAQTMVNLWSPGRRIYEVQVPAELGLRREIGEAVKLMYPIDSMDGGANGLIVAERFRAEDDIITFTVLV